MEIEEILQKELTKLKQENDSKKVAIVLLKAGNTKLNAENEELKICHKTLRRQLDIRIEENKELKDGNTFYNLYIQKREENTQLKQENKDVLDCSLHAKTLLEEKLKEYEKRNDFLEEEHTQLKYKLKEYQKQELQDRLSKGA